MERKIVFFDIDGTLAYDFEHVPASGLAAMRAARENGALCFVATGRPLSQVVKPVREAGFDGFVCSCGQSLYIDGRTVYRHKADRALARRIAGKAAACGLDGFYEAEEGVWGVAAGKHPVAGDFETELRLFTEWGLPVYRSADEGDFFFDKFCVFMHEDSDLNGFLDFVRPWYASTGGESLFHEFVLNGRSKKDGARDVLSLYGIPPENAYAIGDSINDIPIFSLCGHTAAMGSGDDRLKRLAEHVTSGVKEDGVKNALLRWGLI